MQHKYGENENESKIHEQAELDERLLSSIGGAHKLGNLHIKHLQDHHHSVLAKRIKM
jgi:hypothetical protein